jgi:hypothetical protein
MAKTYQTAIDEAREILQDTDDAGYRYSDTILLNILNRALQELGRIRPDAFWLTFDTDDVVIPEVATGDLTLTFPLPMQFYLPVVSFIVAWAEVLDDEFTQDGRAGMLLQQFKTQVLSL